MSMPRIGPSKAVFLNVLLIPRYRPSLQIHAWVLADCIEAYCNAAHLMSFNTYTGKDDPHVKARIVLLEDLSSVENQ